MSEHDRPDIAEQVHQIDFAAAVRAEQEQAALRRRDHQPIPLWLLALIWMATGSILFGSGMFVGWLVWHN
jgi:hypothetical protein